MIDQRLTVCTVAFNAADALTLMWESYCRYHHKPMLYGIDHGSVDGAAEYLQSTADYYQHCPDQEHGQGLDHLCQKVTTPYTLVVDSDCEFVAPVVNDMIAFAEQTECFCVTIAIDAPWSEKTHTWGGYLLPQARISPVCALFKTDTLQRLLHHFSFGTYTLLGNKFYDTGSMLYHAALTANLGVHSPDFVRERVWHYGSMSSLWHPGLSEEYKNQMQERYDYISHRLHELRRRWAELGPHNY